VTAAATAVVDDDSASDEDDLFSVDAELKQTTCFFKFT